MLKDMSEWKFRYETIEELLKDVQAFGLKLPCDFDLSVLGDPLNMNGRIISNRFVVHPMEGSDAKTDGKPGELTLRRYRRYAKGGSAVIWFEATAISEEARANDRQLMINEENLKAFKEIVKMVKDASENVNGFHPYIVLQLTHSGRFGEHRKILYHNELLDRAARIPSDHPIMTDDELDRLKDEFVEASYWAKEAGFDAVDIKSCHRYLLSEALAAHTREGKYGGSYENRTRLLKEIIEKVMKEVNIDVVVRLNIYDAIPYPYGWGSDENGDFDPTEPMKLVRELDNMGVKMISVTAGTPYISPHINRPYDEEGKYHPPEHPLVGVSRLLNLSKLAANNVKRTFVVGTGFSWLRDFAPYIAAGAVKEGWCHLVGFGRQAFANPNFAREILENGRLDRDKLCITCNRCAELKAVKLSCGCVVRDFKVYGPIYRKYLALIGREAR